LTQGEFDPPVKRYVEARVREGAKAVLEEEMTEHLKAGHRELTPTRRGERNGHYTRDLVFPAGKIERLDGTEGMDGPLTTAFLDERLLVVKPGFARRINFSRLVASIYYSDITVTEIRAGLTNWVLMINSQSHQLNESHPQTYQGNRVTQAKDLLLSNDPTSIPTRRALKSTNRTSICSGSW
jgi:hypothetical protein